MMNKPLLIKLRKELTAAMKQVGEANNVTLSVGNASYNPQEGTATFKLGVTTLGENGDARDLEAEAFLKYAEMIGMKKEDLNKEIKINGEPHVIAGYNTKARKNSIYVRSLKNNKVYVVTPEFATMKILEAKANA